MPGRQNIPDPEEVKRHYNFYSLKDDESKHFALVTLIKRKHTLLSVFCPSEHDPFKCTKRLMVLLFSLSTMFAVSSILPFALESAGVSGTVGTIVAVLINTFLVTMLAGPFKAMMVCMGTMDKKSNEQTGCFKCCAKCCACFVKCCCGYPLLLLLCFLVFLVGFLGLVLQTELCITDNQKTTLQACKAAVPDAFEKHFGIFSGASACALFSQCDGPVSCSSASILNTGCPCTGSNSFQVQVQSVCSSEKVLNPQLVAFLISIFTGWIKEAIQMYVVFRLKPKKQVKLLNMRHRKFSVDTAMRKALRSYQPTEEEKEQTGANESLRESELDADDMDEEESIRRFSTNEPPTSDAMERGDANDNVKVELTMNPASDESAATDADMNPVSDESAATDTNVTNPVAQPAQGQG